MTEEEEPVEQEKVQEIVILGPAKFIFPNGSGYDGQYIESENGLLYHGKGTYKFNFVMYTGQWSNGQLINGKLKSLGHEYIGEFKDCKFHGEGVYTWPDGRIYRGEFKDGQVHGKGSYQNFQRVDNTIIEKNLLRHRKLLSKKSELAWALVGENGNNSVGKDVFEGYTDNGMFDSNIDNQNKLKELFDAAQEENNNEEAVEE